MSDIYRNVIFLDSAQATSKNLAQSEFRQILEPAISFPESDNIKIAIQSVGMTNFFINISAAKANNHFYFTDDVGTPDKYDITIPDGSYTSQTLSGYINLAVQNLGFPSGTIQLVGDPSTNKIIFIINAAGYQLFFKAGSCYAILGATLNLKVPAAALTTSYYSQMAPNVAAFNNVQRIYIHTNLSNNTIFASRQSNVLESVSPNSPIGSTFSYDAINLLWNNATNDLRGQIITEIMIYLTDQNGNRITLQDDFSLTLVTSY